MHTECERDWLDRRPHIPCRLCENPLDEDDVTNRSTVHLQCEAELLRPPPNSPNWPQQEADRSESESESADGGTICGFCGEPLSPDEVALDNTVHERCETLSQTPDDVILAEDEGNPVIHCFSCGRIVEEDELVDDGSDPYHRRCLDVNKQLDEICKEGEGGRQLDF